MALSVRGWLGVGAGLAVAMGGVAAGVTADRLLARRRRVAAGDADRAALAALGTVRGHRYTLVTDDEVHLHVQVDEGPQTGEAASPTRPTVVLAHGYGLSMDTWHFQRLALRERYRVVLWDQRGHGRSEPGPPGSGRIDRLAQDFEQVLEAHAPEGPLILVGHSMGGMTVMSLARRRPDLVADRVAAVGLVATSSGGLDQLDFGLPGGNSVARVAPDALAALAKRPRLATRGRRLVSDLELAVVRRWSFASPVPEQVARFAARIVAGTSVGVVSDYMPGFAEIDESAGLAALADVESLVLAGDGDRMTPLSHAEAVASALPRAEYLVIRQAGHLVMLEHPDVVTGHLLDLAARGDRRWVEQHAPAVVVGELGAEVAGGLRRVDRWLARLPRWHRHHSAATTAEPAEQAEQ